MANYITTFGEIRGSVGGVTFFRNRGGICMRMRAVPIQPGTEPQGLQQNIFAGLATDWGGTLTPSSRSQWNFFANQHPVPNKVGQMIKLSGQQMYIKLNCILLTAGVAQTNTPPMNLQVRGLAEAAISLSATGTSVVDIDVLSIVSATEYAYVFMAANVPPGVSNVNNQLVFAGAYVGDDIKTTHQVNVPAKFGVLIAGNYVHTVTHRLNSATGGLSPGLPSSNIIS